jgi:hypothetical protein
MTIPSQVRLNDERQTTACRYVALDMLFTGLNKVN